MARERAFDPDEALDAAVALFWDRGFADTSMDELVRATGVSRYGIYGTFGSKRALFLRALERYGDLIAARTQSELRRPDAGLEAIRGYFHGLHAHSVAAPRRLGCLACNTATEVAPHDAEIAAAVRAIFDDLRGAFRRALENAVEGGELDTRHDLDDLAGYLTAMMRNLAIMERAGYDHDEMKRTIEIGLAAFE